MKDKNSNLDKSIEKYLNGESNKEESEIVDQFYDSFSSRPNVLDELPNRKQKAIKARIHKNILKKIDAKPKRLIDNYKLSVLAAFFCLAFFYLFFNKDKKIRNIELVSANGQHKEVILEDGTKITLNSSSKIIYPTSFKDSTTREVTLIGEAFFDVAKNPNKPFLIHTPRMEISVLGTAFNVRDYEVESNAETALIRGKISISKSGNENQKYLLIPKQKFIVSKKSANGQKSGTPIENEVNKNEVAIQNFEVSKRDGSALETEWLLNRITIKEEPLSDIAIKLERIYGVKLKIINPNVSKQKYSATFENENLNNILNALQIVEPFKYKTINDQLIEIE